MNKIFCGFATTADPEKLRCGSGRRGDGGADNPTSKEAPEHLGKTDLGTRAARGRWESRTSGRRRWGRSGDPDGEGTGGIPGRPGGGDRGVWDLKVSEELSAIITTFAPDPLQTSSPRGLGVTILDRGRLERGCGSILEAWFSVQFGGTSPQNRSPRAGGGGYRT